MSQKFDIERARAETPGIDRVVHLNNCGAGLMPSAVLDAVIAHLRLEAEIGGYEAEDKAEAEIEHCYDAVAALLNCHRDEIAVVENATVGDLNPMASMSRCVVIPCASHRTSTTMRPISRG